MVLVERAMGFVHPLEEQNKKRRDKTHDHFGFLFVISLFCLVDDRIGHLPKHPQAKLYPSELVTIGLLFALKGCSFRAFYRWLSRDYSEWFPLPERTRLQRLLAAHQDLCDLFLADPTFFTVVDTYGIELIHPWREGRSPKQLGKKGRSNHRWIVGIKLCLCWLINSHGEGGRLGLEDGQRPRSGLLAHDQTF